MPTSETLTFAGPIAGTAATLTTCKAFDCYTGITTTGLATESPSPTITARMVGAAGSGVSAVCELAECVMGHLETPSGSWPNRTGGQSQAGVSTIDYDDVYPFTAREGDYFVQQRQGEDFAVWEVVSAPPYLGDGHEHHVELRVVPANDKDIALT